MAALHILVFAFLTVTGFGVTDEEFQIHQSSVATVIREIKSEIQDMSKVLKTQEWEISRQATIIMQQNEMISRLESDRKWKPEVLETDNLQNATIEERVSLLELQVVDLDEKVVDLDEDVDFLFDEQVIQDERLLTLEQTTDALSSELVTVDDELEDLRETTLVLDLRVTVLEENGGNDGNSSVAELEVRVETLEAIAADHETSLTYAEADIEELEVTDLSHDVRISALEKNNGSGGSENDTIAFHSVLTSYSTIPAGSSVIFNEIISNQGDGYDSSTGVFTVPPGGDGVYYFSMIFLVQPGEIGFFEMHLSGDVICSTIPDHSNNGASDFAPGSCSTIVDATAGNEVEVVYCHELSLRS